MVSDRCLACDPEMSHARTTKQRGYSYDHRMASKRYRAEHPLCERCMCVFGILNSAASEEMHHIESIVDSPNKRMDSSNWLALCRSCHQELEGDVMSGMQIKRWSDQHYVEVING